MSGTEPLKYVNGKYVLPSRNLSFKNEISCPLRGLGPLRKLSISVPMSLSAAYAHRASTVNAAVLKGVSRLASGNACISPKLSGNALKTNDSFFLPTAPNVSFTACFAVFFNLSKILITIPPYNYV